MSLLGMQPQAVRWPTSLGAVTAASLPGSREFPRASPPCERAHGVAVQPLAVGEKRRGVGDALQSLGRVVAEAGSLHEIIHTERAGKASRTHCRERVVGAG